MIDATPNILYIHSHDTGRCIQPYGYGVPTPRLQVLAEQGVLFRNAFTVSPTCSPSRASLFTGTYPRCHGMTSLAHRGGRLNDYAQHLIHQLKPLGYHTALAGMEHTAPGDAEAGNGVVTQTIGYDEHVSEVLSGDELSLRASRWLVRRPAERPWFLSVGFFETHRTRWERDESVHWHNGEASPIGDARYVRPPAPLPDLPETREDFADFVESVKRFDRYVGRVLDSLEASGQAEQTIVVCTTDHGIAFPGMKCNLTEAGTGVMLMMRWLGRAGWHGGRVIDEMTMNIDLFPTLCDLLGRSVPPWVRGKSLVPLVETHAPPPHPAVFAEINHHTVTEPQRSIRTERFKLIQRLDRGSPDAGNCDPSRSKQVLGGLGWPAGGNHEELYDLVLDPTESNNLINDALYLEQAADLRDRLLRWRGETGDACASAVTRTAGAVSPLDQD